MDRYELLCEKVNEKLASAEYTEEQANIMQCELYEKYVVESFWSSPVKKKL